MSSYLSWLWSGTTDVSPGPATAPTVQSTSTLSNPLLQEICRVGGDKTQYLSHVQATPKSSPVDVVEIWKTQLKKAPKLQCFLSREEKNE
jgi:hypothetical protein